MKKFVLPALAILVCLSGYVGWKFLFSSQGNREDIRGDAILRVTLLMDGMEPLENIEVDVGRQPGPPPVGGTAMTDGSGIATFSIKPGTYVIFFNEIGFPKNLEFPTETTNVEVTGGVPVDRTLTVRAREMDEGDRSPRPGEFSNGQQFLRFVADDFEVNYPNWPNVDRAKFPEPEKMQVVVSNEGCTFMINAVDIPAETTFRDIVEKRLGEQTQGKGIYVTVKDIGESTAHMEAEMSVGTTVVRSATYEYSTNGKRYYGIGFVAPDKPFGSVCQPLIQEILKSVRVK